MSTEPHRRARRRAPPVLPGALLALALLVAAPHGTALAQSESADPAVCSDELNAAHRRVADQPNGVAAAHLLRTAVELLEPALPPAPGTTAPADLADHPDAVWLAERRLLPSGWTPDAVEPDAWRGALDRLRRGYGLGAAETEGASAPRALALDLGRTLADLRGAVRPLGVIARDGDRVAFNAVIWNYTPYPRLLVLRPPEGAVLADGPQAALAALSSCARPVEAYVTSPAGAALELFLSAPETVLRLLASTPAAPERWPLELTRDEAPEAFAYDAAALDGIDAVSVVFEGPSMSLGSVLGFLPRMDGNVGALDIPYYLEFPR